jgi:two-component system, cell cycle response regulator
LSARILIVEDNPTNMELMVYLLQAFGYVTLTAINGKDGLNVILAELPDLIICDIELPGINGYEIARQLKNDAMLHTIPLVAVTAFAMVGDRDRVLAAGFNGYIAKPIEPEVFVAQVEAYLPADRLAPSRMPPEQSREPAVQKRELRATVLVVDNFPPNLQLIQSLLEPFGYKVIRAFSVDEALIMVGELMPDLIISDLHFPGKNGYDFIKAVKANPLLAGIPFIFLSATARNEVDMEHGRRLGAARFLLRPIESDVLLAEIEGCLQLGRKNA